MDDRVKMSHVDQTTLIRGSFSTGKTQRLIDEVLALLDAGTPSRDIVVFCAAPAAADDFAYRLKAAAAGRAEAVPYHPYLDLCQQLLGSKPRLRLVG